MSQRAVKRLLIVGWDAADWKIIDSIVARGGMRVVRNLVEQGVRGDLATLEPTLSPLLWTSIATGKTADKHGILTFVEPDPAGERLRIASSTSRKTKALWNMVTQSGLRTHVVNWYATHPAEPITGVCISNLFQAGMPASRSTPWPMPDDGVHPSSRAGEIAALRVHPDDLGSEALLPLLPHLAEMESDERVKTLTRHLAQCVSVHNAATAILAEDKSWNCTMVFYDALDTVGHHFMQYHPPRMPHVSERDFELFRDVMFSLYQYHDMMLGTLLKLAGEDTTVILLSDHGFHSDHLRPVTQGLPAAERAAAEASWHRPFGVLAMSGPGIKSRQPIYGANLLDITPTALALLGLPVGSDMDGRVLLEVLDLPAPVESLFSWDLLKGESGMHPPGLRHDPLESQAAIRQLVDLGYLAALPADAQAKLDLTRRETAFNLAVVYMTTQRAELAIPVLQELVANRPQEPRYVLALARCMLISNRFTEAADALRAFLERRPSSLEGRLLLAGTLANAGKEQEASSLIEQIEREHPDRPDLAVALGDIFSAMRRWESAAKHYRAAEAHDPGSARVHFGLARAALARQRFGEAIDHALRAVEIQHVFPEAHHLLGAALTWVKDYRHAIESFKVAVSMAPGLLDAHRYLASIYRHLGDGVNAPKHRDIALRLISEHGSNHVSLDFLRREAPMGPQEWARSMGMASEAADDAGSPSR